MLAVGGWVRVPTRSDVLVSLGHSIDNTSKTRAIFEITKGDNVQHDGSATVSILVPEDQRGCRFAT